MFGSSSSDGGGSSSDSGLLPDGIMTLVSWLPVSADEPTLKMASPEQGWSWNLIET